MNRKWQFILPVHTLLCFDKWRFSMNWGTMVSDDFAFGDINSAWHKRASMHLETIEEVSVRYLKPSFQGDASVVQMWSSRRDLLFTFNVLSVTVLLRRIAQHWPLQPNLKREQQNSKTAATQVWLKDALYKHHYASSSISQDISVTTLYLLLLGTATRLPMHY